VTAAAPSGSIESAAAAALDAEAHVQGPSSLDLNGQGAAVEGERALCPYFHEAVELVGKRWTGAIVHALLPGPLRFSELAQSIPQISDRLLSMRLKELEGFGIVARQVYEHAPVRVEYELTAKGRALEPAVAALRSWAREWLQA
jgi:DNA-binding HxlR family transcriptional regulator